MNILFAGYAANEAAHRLIEKEKPALSCRFSDRFIKLTEEKTLRNHVSYDSITRVSEHIGNIIAEDDIMELSDTGILGSLWEFAEKHNTGIEINLENISINQETIEIFELLDINPYTYPSGGSWLIRSENAYELAHALKREGITASVIGRETDLKDRVIRNADEIRFLTPVDRLLKDEQGKNNLRFL